MNNKISPLFILDDSNKTIFDNDKYVIPLYQRAFAWSDKEIDQLIDDINDFTAEHYYLGSLIVNLNKDGIYEVIDGQQRLTALFLLLDYVGDYNWGKDKLCYECRERSNFTLNCLAELTNNNIESYLANADKIEETLICGRDIIDGKFIKDKIDKKKFIANLKKVILYRIEVPPHTDLNRYFEIMNVRGEQLEQHDILKAELMKPLNREERADFALIWDACRDMTGYVQMHFSETAQREALFGEYWDSLNSYKIGKFIKKAEEKTCNTDGRSALDIIQSGALPTQIDGQDEADRRIRFESVIGFPYFLLHVLKVFASTELDAVNASTESDQDDYGIPKLLDDKKLLNTYKSVIEKGKQKGKPIDKKDFSLKFIKCLLKCRYLFDKYIIKREYKNDDKDGAWSLKALWGKNGKAQYYNTEYKNKGEHKTTKERRHNDILMLQSCLRISYTSPKVMHWITESLKWLYNGDNISQFKSEIEKIAQEPAKEFILKKDFCQGVNTPHIVMNYLDYVLWTKRLDEPYKKLKFDDFTFEFRNSVEHWYPQHPFSDDNKEWKEIDPTTTYDRFGNLCLLQRNVNSKFSNASPMSKKGYETQINKGSLKLRIMSNQTTDNSQWVLCDCARHEEQMIEILCTACGMDKSQIWDNNCAKI